MNHLMFFHQEESLRNKYQNIAIRSVFYEAVCQLIYNKNQGKVKVAYDCLLYPHISKKVSLEEEKNTDSKMQKTFNFHDMNFLCKVVNEDTKKDLMQQAESYNALGCFIFHFLNIAESNQAIKGTYTSSLEETYEQVFETMRTVNLIPKSIGSQGNFRKKYFNNLKYFSPIIYSIYFLTSAQSDKQYIKEAMAWCLEWDIEKMKTCLGMAVGCRKNLLRCESRNTKDKKSVFSTHELIDFPPYIPACHPFTFPIINYSRPKSK